MCGRLLALLSGIIHTIQATHFQYHTLFNSYKMVRSPPLCSHLLTHRRLMVLLLQVSCPAHCYHAVHSAHLFLRAPLATSQAKQCQLRSPSPSRSSHSFSSHRVAASRLLLPSCLSHQSPSHSWTLLCRRLHPVTPLRMCPRRRLISRSLRYFLTLQCRRLSTVFTPHLWTLPCRRSHTVLFLRTFLRRWVLAQLPRFLSTRLSRLLYAALYYTILPHNYRSRSSLLDVSSRTILWTAKALFVSAHHL